MGGRSEVIVDEHSYTVGLEQRLQDKQVRQRRRAEDLEVVAAYAWTCITGVARILSGVHFFPKKVDDLFSERELKFMFAICRRPSVCRLSVVCNVRAPYSGDSNFRQCFYAMWYLGHQ